jgi:type IV secretion system protein TrbL
MANVVRSAMAGSGGDSASPPVWAQKLKRSQHRAHGASVALHTIRSADRGGGGVNPKLDDNSHS